VQAAVIEGIDAACARVLIDPDLEVDGRVGRDAVALGVHVPKLPGRVDVQQGERQGTGPEGLSGQVQHRRRVLADRIHHDRTFDLSDHFTQDVNGLGLQRLEVGQARRDVRHSSVASTQSLLRHLARASPY
jgi:hypothetical protein